jgi:hypothetical protein
VTKYSADFAVQGVTIHSPNSNSHWTRPGRRTSRCEDCGCCFRHSWAHQLGDMNRTARLWNEGAKKLALTSGMHIIDASFSRRLLAMQGPPESITSASNSLLGILTHFTPRKTQGNTGVTIDGKIYLKWMRRLGGDFPVGGTLYTPFERSQISYKEGNWFSRLMVHIPNSDHRFNHRFRTQSEGVDDTYGSQAVILRRNLNSTLSDLSTRMRGKPCPH